jgi:hypothetical protein
MRSLSWALALLLVPLFPLDALGGYKNAPYWEEVRILDAYGDQWGGNHAYAEGSLGYARASADSSQYIGCTVVVDYGSRWSKFYFYYPGRIAYCSARTVAGKYLSCQTRDPNLILSALSITDSSWISFSSDYNGSCSSLRVSKHSGNSPHN